MLFWFGSAKCYSYTCSQRAPSLPNANLPSLRVTTAVPTFKHEKINKWVNYRTRNNNNNNNITDETVNRSYKVNYPQKKVNNPLKGDMKKKSKAVQLGNNLSSNEHLMLHRFNKCDNFLDIGLISLVHHSLR